LGIIFHSSIRLKLKVLYFKCCKFVWTPGLELGGFHWNYPETKEPANYCSLPRLHESNMCGPHGRCWQTTSRRAPCTLFHHLSPVLY
jgi:hypothetical protein